MQTDSENPELPKKKKKNPIKKISEPKRISSKKTPADNLASENLQKMLREVIMKSVDKKMRSNYEEMDALVATMEEFLRSFIVIGYNLNNEPLVITNARTQLEADALQTALTRLFISIQSGGPSSSGF